MMKFTDELRKLTRDDLLQVEIGGDRFLLTIPFHDYWYALETEIHDPLPVIERTSRLTVFRPHRNGVDYELADYGFNASRLFRPIASYNRKLDNTGVSVGLVWEEPGMQDYLLDIRPMLIPINGNGELDTSFRENNPDWLIFRGGYLRLEYEHEELSPSALSPVTYVTNMEQKAPTDIPIIRNQDTLSLVEYNPDDPKGELMLEWRSWKGCLISVGPVFHCTLMTADRLKILPH